MYDEYMLPEAGGKRILREIYDWIESGLIAVLVVVLVFTFAARLVGVKGISMQPSLEDRDRLIATTLYSSLKTGDIVVLTKPNSRDNEPLIKRVIAAGGQTIDIDLYTGDVYVDGEIVPEPYVAEKIMPGSRFEVEFPQVVPYGHIFVMGDNRNHSWDSRSAELGMVDERYVLGKVVYRILPYDRFGPP